VGNDIIDNLISVRAKAKGSLRQILNIGDCITWYGESVSSPSSQELVRASESELYNALPKSILCMPIYNGQRQVIGVAQLINKVSLI
jgi:cGMP-specific 3',5'-cyclic phosphodiesterase